MCPFCDELSYPSKNRPPLIMPDKKITAWICPNNHVFYTYERVCAHQEWADNVFNGVEQPIWRRKSDRWLKEIRKQNFGVEDYINPED